MAKAPEEKVSYTCPECGKKYRVPKRYSTAPRCPKCQKTVNKASVSYTPSKREEEERLLKEEWLKKEAETAEQGAMSQPLKNVYVEQTEGEDHAKRPGAEPVRASEPSDKQSKRQRISGKRFWLMIGAALGVFVFSFIFTMRGRLSGITTTFMALIALAMMFYASCRRWPKYSKHICLIGAALVVWLYANEHRFLNEEGVTLMCLVRYCSFIIMLGMPVYLCCRRWAKYSKHITVGGSVVLSIIVVWYGWGDTYPKYFNSETGYEYHDDYGRWSGKHVYRSITRWDPYFTSSGPMAGDVPKPHGHWTTWQFDPLVNLDEFYWYGDKISQGEWYLRNK